MPGITLKVKHTPGPWQVIAGEFKDDGIVAYEIRMPEAILSKSNADLIAAAPDMLEALKAMTHLMQEAADEIDTDVRHPMRGYGGKTVRENIHAAKEAIAKAEGQ
jgi:hypothetical protein